MLLLKSVLKLSVRKRNIRRKDSSPKSINQLLQINKFRIPINMNILSSEQMQQTQIQLLNLVTHPNYTLNLPTYNQLALIHKFTSHLTPQAPTKTQDSIHKMVRLTNNVRAASLHDPNTIFRMFAYHILNVQYQQKYRRGCSPGEGDNSSILQTLKCVLYSNNLDLTLIKNRRFDVNNIQIKALSAHFFRYMETLSSKFNAHRMKCVEWLLQNNPLLVNLFVLLFRSILNALQIQKSDNYQLHVDSCHSLVNLLQFFDIGYRNLGPLFLQYEDGLFIAINDGEIVVGEYFQNEKQKQDQKQQMEIISGIKVNMIESVFMTVLQDPPTQQIRKVSIDKDKNFLNTFMERRQSQTIIQSIYVNEANASLLKDNRKMEITPINLEKAALHISRYEDESLNQKHSYNLPQHQSFPFFKDSRNSLSKELGTETLRESPGHTITEFAKNHLHSFKSLKLIDTSIELDSSFHNGNYTPITRAQSKNYITKKNKFKSQQFRSPLYTPQILKVPNSDTIFNRTANKVGLNEDNAHLAQCKNKLTNISFKNQFIEVTTCGCQKVKINKNIMDHNVIDVSYRPKNQNSYLPALLSPLNFNHQYQQFKPTQDLTYLTPNRYVTEENLVHTPKTTYQKSNDKKPTFLKNIQDIKKNNNQSNKPALQSNQQMSRLTPPINDQSTCSQRRFSQMAPLFNTKSGQQVQKKSARERMEQRSKINKKLEVIIPYAKYMTSLSNVPAEKYSTLQQKLSTNTDTNKMNSKNLVQQKQPQSAKIIHPNQTLINSPKSKPNLSSHKPFNHQNPQKKIEASTEPIPTIILTQPKQLKAVNKSKKLFGLWNNDKCINL